MDKTSKKQLDEYFAEVSKALMCPPKQKKAFINQLRSDVESFLNDNPDATADEIKACFGSAESIAQSFITNSEPGTLKKALDIKKVILIGVIVALVIYLAFVVISLIDVHTEAHGYFREGFMMITALQGGFLR